MTRISLKTICVSACLLGGLTAPVMADDADTFTIWWFESADSAMGIAWTDALEQFKMAHPDIEVVFEQKSWDQMVQAGTLILNSDAAPDLLEYGKGNGTAGLAASLGLLADLDDVAEQRGWTNTLNDAQLALGRYDDRGVFGTGPLVGIPNYAEFVTVYYNKDMFDARGLSVPTTLAEFEAVMDVFVADGITPIAEAANDYPALHLWYQLALSEADNDWVTGFQGLTAPLDTAPFLHASEALQDWVNAGYVSTDATGLTAADMTDLFESGTSPMVVTGTWYLGQFGSNITDFEWDHFLFPGNTIHPASTGNMWVVPERADNKDLAYDFIDITLSAQNQTLLGNSGGVALGVDAEMISDPIGSAMTAASNEIAAANGLGYYPDWPVPGYYEVMRQTVQALVGLTITPENANVQLEQFYNDGFADAN